MKPSAIAIFRSSLLAVLLILTCSALQADGTTVIKAKAWLDVAAGKWVTPANIVIEGGLIAAINPADLPAGATVIELPNQMVLPGLIDIHTHLSLRNRPRLGI